MKLTENETMKILHLPTSVGGNAHNLAQGERQLGFDSKTLVAAQNWLQYPADINLGLERLPKWLSIAPRFLAFLKIRNEYDIFHFNFGSSLINTPTVGLCQLDLPYYSSSSKKFVTYNGCDARQKHPTMQRMQVSACHNPKCYGGQCNSGFIDKNRRKAIDKMDRYVDHMWALTPDLLYFLPKEKSSFLPFALNPENYHFQPLIPQYPLKILHAPTNREAKGTDFILKALTHLKDKHPNKIEIVLVEKIPHEAAIEIYKTADLVIDQVLIGWYGALAAEVMLLGKPVVAFISDAVEAYLPDGMLSDLNKGVINANIFNLEIVIEKYIKDKDLLIEQGRLAREYSLKWHDYKTVSKITTEQYKKSMTR